MIPHYFMHLFDVFIFCAALLRCLGMTVVSLTTCAHRLFLSPLPTFAHRTFLDLTLEEWFLTNKSLIWEWLCGP